MSARTQCQQVPFTTSTAFASAPIFLPTVAQTISQSPVVPSGQTYARTFPVIAAKNGSFTSYPPPQHDVDEQLLHTYASFREEPVIALSVNACHNDTWSLCVAVPIPSINNPTLLALNYMIKYATTGDNGNSTIQTDTILTAEKLPESVVTQAADLNIYKNQIGFASRMIDHDAALCLSTTLAVKCNGGGEQWSHYVDNQHMLPNVRVVDKETHLYVVFHVCEYPTVKTVRSLSVEVSATWQKEEVEKKAVAEAERKAKEEADKKAKEEEEKRIREAEERQARAEEKQARDEEKQARADEKRARDEEKQARAEEKQTREEEKQARAEEKQARDEERQARKENKAAPSVANAPDVADDNMQTVIAKKMTELNIQPCPNGYGFKKTSTGYECSGGGHKITFEQLGMK